jgi:hypothetical protein
MREIVCTKRNHSYRVGFKRVWKASFICFQNHQATSLNIDCFLLPSTIIIMGDAPQQQQASLLNSLFGGDDNNDD